VPGVASFLGTGWSFPPSFTRRGASVVMVSGDADIHESLQVLFSTVLGERIMLAQYGTTLWEKVFAVLNATLINQIKTIVTQEIIAWEPRITVLGVNVIVDDAPAGLIELQMDYIIRLTNTRSNFVYPFYQGEATLTSVAR
jgi:phage baseplate assembly protein W